MNLRLRIPKPLQFAFGHHAELNKFSISFLIFTLLQSITIIAASIANMVLNSQDMEPSTAVYFLASVAILAMFCLCYFAVDAILNENKMMIYSYIVISLFLMGRLIYGLAWGGEADELIVMIPSLFILFFEVCQIVLSIPLINSFGWKLYRKIGSSKTLHQLYSVYHAFIAVLKIDFVCSLHVGMLGFFFVVFDFWWVYLLFGVGLLISLVSAPLVVYFGIRQEHKLFCILFLLISLLMPSFLIYKIIVLWLPGTHDIVTEWGGSSMSQLEIKIGLSLLAAFAFLVRIILMAMTCACMFNFGKGLKETFRRDNKKNRASETDKLFLSSQKSQNYYTHTDDHSSCTTSTAGQGHALFAVNSSGEIVQQHNHNGANAKVNVALTRSISDDSGFMGSSSNTLSDDDDIVVPITNNHHPHHVHYNHHH
ncbi:hypothetical protein FDP41_008780 [Naegleria fowleri]|uniref:DUF7789 domain-containing protein n=1 Tax=Naegleria fowleri TaxID=5763 RepID=A0A6A5BG28_NAEFO|nr:uncharacterized protein FDP41_008780 [Naegleria fowleri]KAF0972928.1 hypothetical protein FDP41_008780 [Naegleria fowleri]